MPDLLCPNCGASASLPLGLTCDNHQPVPVPQEVDYDRTTLVDVLADHWRTGVSECGCGWTWPNKSHSGHVADVYEMTRRLRQGVAS